MRREVLSIITAVIAVIGLYTPTAAGGWDMKSEFREHSNLESTIRNGTFTSLDQCRETLGWECQDAWWEWQDERAKAWRPKAPAWWKPQGKLAK